MAWARLGRRRSGGSVATVVVGQGSRLQARRRRLETAKDGGGVQAPSSLASVAPRAADEAGRRRATDLDGDAAGDGSQ
jgi:hypothetical protein